MEKPENEHDIQPTSELSIVEKNESALSDGRLYHLRVKEFELKERELYLKDMEITLRAKEVDMEETAKSKEFERSRQTAVDAYKQKVDSFHRIARTTISMLGLICGIYFHAVGDSLGYLLIGSGLGGFGISSIDAQSSAKNKEKN